MISPCPRCGATKTDPVYHGVLYRLVSVFGYRLQICSRCRIPRFVRRHPEESHGSSHGGNGLASAPELAPVSGALSTGHVGPTPQRDRATTAASPDRESGGCPACGSNNYHRTKRTRLERLRKRPHMARCEKCGTRFPHPGRREKYLEPLKLAGAATLPLFAEEKSSPDMAEKNTQPKVTKPVAAPNSSDRELFSCPACGSAEYHRTKRTRLERFRLRPRMARCEKCGERFPYPGHRRKYPQALQRVGPAATVSRSGEERIAPTIAGEGSEADASHQVAVIDYTDHGLRCCPHCGSSKYHRSRRTFLDGILMRPTMATSEKCGSRFPYPKHHERPSSIPKPSEEAENVSQVGEEGRVSKAAEESSPALVGKQESATDSSDRNLSRCPFCGSASYRRSRRTKLEHLMLRPKMARCRHCRKRFPYPKR